MSRAGITTSTRGPSPGTVNRASARISAPQTLIGGGGALLGTVIGAVAGRDPAGAAIGAGAGAGAGAAFQAVTRGKAVRIPAETILSFNWKHPWISRCRPCSLSISPWNRYPLLIGYHLTGTLTLYSMGSNTLHHQKHVRQIYTPGFTDVGRHNRRGHSPGNVRHPNSLPCLRARQSR